MVITDIKGTTAAMRNLLTKDIVERILTEVKAMDALDLMTFRNLSMTKFFQLAVENMKRKTKRGRKKKLQPTVMGENGAVKDTEVTADSSKQCGEEEGHGGEEDSEKGTEGERGQEPRRSRRGRH